MHSGESRHDGANMQRPGRDARPHRFLRGAGQGGGVLRIMLSVPLGLHPQGIPSRPRRVEGAAALRRHVGRGDPDERPAGRWQGYLDSTQLPGAADDLARRDPQGREDPADGQPGYRGQYRPGAGQGVLAPPAAFRVECDRHYGTNAGTPYRTFRELPRPGLHSLPRNRLADAAPAKHLPSRCCSDAGAHRDARENRSARGVRSPTSCVAVKIMQHSGPLMAIG